MDFKKEKNGMPRKKRLRSWLVLAIAVSIIGGLSIVARSTALHAVKAGSMLTAEVKRGELLVSVQGPGKLVPAAINWVTAGVAGRVDKVIHKPGAAVVEGDLLVELINPELQREAEEITWELEVVRADVAAHTVELRSSVLAQESVVSNMHYEYDAAQLKMDAEEQVIAKAGQIIPALEHARTKLAAEQCFARWKTEQERLTQLREKIKSDQQANAAHLEKQEKKYQRAQQQLDMLHVSAPADGVIQELALEPGQRVVLGDNIAKIARADLLQAALNIPQTQINNVKPGQPVSLNLRGSTMTGEVLRVEPAVASGTVKVFITLLGALPSNARPELDVVGDIEVARIKDALYVERPTFAQSNSKGSIYRLNNNGNKAYRTAVEYGIGSASQIQILAGLAAGEKVVVSDNSSYASFDEINIKE